ncbi:MAG: endolytic transglycosylase MltG [Micrococcales bacterium]|nr:endolytic transglycosylase MltG [Micrococcales bacterium]
MDQWDLFGDEEPAEPAAPPAPAVPSRRALREAAEAKKQVKRTKRNKGLTAAISVLILALLGGIIYAVGMPIARSWRGEDKPVEITDYPGPPSSETVMVTIGRGFAGSDMAAELKAKGVVATEQAFITAFSANPRSNEIQPGTYQLNLQMPAADAVAALLDPANRESSRLTVTEGMRAEQVYQVIADALEVPLEEVEAAADPAAIGLPAEAGGLVEGWLFPATYNISEASTPQSLLQEMVSKTKTTLTDLKVPQEDWQNTIILASIVEKEVRLDQDRPKAARVFLNRLDAKTPLGSDATVHYAVGEFGSVWTTDSQRASDSPYNTYKVVGLPKGPISNPGKKAIEAVLKPDEGKWMFFVTVDLCSGATEFNVDKASHDKSVAKLQAWIKANPNWDKPDGCKG